MIVCVMCVDVYDYDCVICVYVICLCVGVMCLKYVLLQWGTFLCPGVMQYYQAQLADFIQYPDLRTEVFQCFRELGNAMLFTMLIEQSLVCELTYSLHYVTSQFDLPVTAVKSTQQPAYV